MTNKSIFTTTLTGECNNSTVIGRAKILTDPNRAPCGILPVGNDILLFGYSILVAPPASIAINDVFRCYQLEKTTEGYQLSLLPMANNGLTDPKFINDFNELYQDYQNVYLSQLRHINQQKFAIFQSGNTIVKILRWTSDADGTLRYLDNQGVSHLVYPPVPDFEWLVMTCDNSPPSILDEIFVEIHHGTLNFKSKHQELMLSLEGIAAIANEISIHYAQVGVLILLKILLAHETPGRYFVCNTLSQKIDQFDSMSQFCLPLPDHQGLLFPDGYYLANGDLQSFEPNLLADLNYQELIHSPRGDQVLYLFHHHLLNKQVLLSYDLIHQEIQTTIMGHGYARFDDGRLVVLCTDDHTPTGEYSLQIWQTPYTRLPSTLNTRCGLEALAGEDGRNGHHGRGLEALAGEDKPVLKLGKHHFGVNTQPLDLTLVPYDRAGQQQMAIHLLGTDFFEALDDLELNAVRDAGEHLLISETPEVYRSEYLAATLLFNQVPRTLENLQSLTSEELLETVRHATADRYEEGFESGVHEVDAALILAKLLPITSAAGLLRFSPQSRGVAQLFWVFTADQEQCKIWDRTAKSWHQLQSLFGMNGQALAKKLVTELTPAIHHFLQELPLISLPENHPLESTAWVSSQAAQYLLAELANDPLAFTTSAAAMQIVEGFWQALEQRDKRRQFEDDLRTLKLSLPNQLALTQAWLGSYVTSLEPSLNRYFPEAVTILLTGKRMTRQVNATPLQVEITNLVGQHPLIKNRTLILQWDEFAARLQHFIAVRRPAFRTYRQLRSTIIEREQKRLRLAQFQAQPLPTWVCNRLINEVHFNFIGNHLANQLGTVDDSISTPLKGLLLLLSPPGYGKTTLVEYLAYRLGLILVKINSTLLGPQLTSLDPTIAPNAITRQELDKLNLAFAMGNNVMLFLDDIQHCHPTFLQQFTSLADAQRSIVGIWHGQARTYELRGKRFCLIMAGSLDPNTGDIVKLPSTLTSRADSYDLSMRSQDHETLFARSYLENALTAHPLLAPLATRTPEELDKLIRLAQGEELPSSDFSHFDTQPELEDLLAVLKKLLRVQEVVFKVHQHYLLSRAQTDQHRTEPPFQLPGSYRQMNQLTAQVRVDMTAAELEKLLADHYAREAQLLTTGREENLLKFAELQGNMTAAQLARWGEIKSTFHRFQTLGDQHADPLTRIVTQLSLLTEQLQHLHATTLSQATVLKQLHQHLAALPQLVTAISNSQLEVNIVNQLPAGLEDSLKTMINMVDKTLLPIVQDYERKSKLDLTIFERIKEMLDLLKDLHKDLVVKGKVQKQYKPLSFKD